MENNYGLGDKVIWHNKVCVVTNPFVCGGKKIIISPVGNGNSPAKYFTVFPDEVKPK